MNSHLGTGVLGLLSLVACVTTTQAGDARADELTPQAVAAVKNAFPAAQIVSFGFERERDVHYYEVAVREGERKLEIEVTPEGAIGEIETEVTLASLPRAAMDGIVKSAGGAAVREIQRHEVRGVPEDGTFVAVNPPLVFFEATYEVAGTRKEIAVTPDGKPLPSELDDDREGDQDAGDGDDVEDDDD